MLEGDIGRYRALKAEADRGLLSCQERDDVEEEFLARVRHHLEAPRALVRDALRLAEGKPPPAREKLSCVLEAMARQALDILWESAAPALASIYDSRMQRLVGRHQFERRRRRP
ncbi:MAG TPA: hypothetical protein VNO81_14030 [Candidatus Nitrosotenuis sp.]|nr:hypothetical protein [Candidatus Nitrosotenuis sp.]